MPIFYVAKVTSNNDPDQAGKVQIRIEPFHDGFSDADLPWSKPAPIGTGGGTSQGVSSIPENNSFVWVFFEDEENYRHPFYLFDVSLKNINAHTYFNQNVKPQITGYGGSYPNVKFQYFKNGICVGVSSDSANKEVFIFHPAGNGFFYINNLGAYSIKDGFGNTVKTTASNIIELNGNTKELVTWSELNTALQTMLGLLNIDIVKANGIGGTATGTTTLNITPSKTAKLKTS